jgi:hypothetical protein
MGPFWMAEHRSAATQADFDALLGYLPRLASAPGSSYFGWAETATDGEGCSQMPYVRYAQWVSQFFQLAGQPCWSDSAYDPKAAERMINDDALVGAACLEQLKSMLTYCVRGERFCDGHWAALIESGRIVELLRRLRQFRPD